MVLLTFYWCEGELKVNELQRKLLSIIKYFDNFCEKHNIRYFLMGGSALGCARHKGFIPWDDDIDVFIPYKDYLELIKYSSEISNDGFCLQQIKSQENGLYIGKLRLKGTFVAENNKKLNPDICNGIFIDIMILFNSPNCLLSKIKMYVSAKILSANSLLFTGYKTPSKFKRFFIKLSSHLVKRRGEDYFFKKITRFSNSETKQVCHIFGRASFKNSFYKKEWFASSTRMPFESLQLNMPIGFKDYLKRRYGKKYMEMPSQKIIDSYPSHASYFNLDSDKDERQPRI